MLKFYPIMFYYLESVQRRFSNAYMLDVEHKIEQHFTHSTERL